jgi:hypothetical protein
MAALVTLLALSVKPTLRFAPPVAIPVFCPQAICKYGGTTAADGFKALPGSNTVVGPANKTVVFSTNGGSTFGVLPARAAKEGLAQSVVGPGPLFGCGTAASPRRVCSLGNANINTSSLYNNAAVGDHLSVWDIDTNGTLTREIVKGSIIWDLPQTNLCLFSAYSGRAIRFGGTWLKTIILKDNCTKPPTPGWGDFGGSGNIHLFESKDRLHWTWASLVCAGNITGGAEGANENDMVIDASGALLVVFRVDGGDGFPLHDHKVS